MLDIQSVNHIGIRISDKAVTVPFYEQLGFQFESDVGFEKGHPIIMAHPSGVVLNLLGPAAEGAGHNILMDEPVKYPGITHFALTVSSIDETRAFLGDTGIPITGEFSFGKLSAVFIRDPDRNVIELDAYSTESKDGDADYSAHP